METENVTSKVNRIKRRDVLGKTLHQSQVGEIETFS